MSVIAAVYGAPTARRTARRGGGALLPLLLFTLVRSAEVLAGDQASDAGARRPLPDALLAPNPSFSIDRSQADSKTFSATEFTPRGHTQVNADSSASFGFGSDAPMYQGATVWQRMAEFRSQNRVRLLTLWETRGSTLSLQAGKHGGPSLQWSSPWMMHDSASHGLFDRLFSVPLRGSPGLARSAPVRTPAEAPAAKPAIVAPAAAAASR
jgi:hypothetical protein